MRSVDHDRAVALYDRVAATCEASGWHVYRPYRELVEAPTVADDALFDRLSHAVRHAQACVVYVGGSSSGVGAELVLAREGRRPIIAIHIDGDEVSPVLESMLARYERAVVIRGADADECIFELHRAIRDPAWMREVRIAASEHAEQI